jgi:hypothetical protein
MLVPFVGNLFRRATGLRAVAMRRVRPETMENVADALFQAGFSPLAYRSAYDDLAKSLQDDHAATLHFVAYCREDTRPFPIHLALEGLRRLFQLRVSLRFKANVAVAVLNSVCAPSSPLWNDSASIQRAFWGDLLAILRQAGKPYFIIGDSHAHLYRRIVCRKDGLLIPIPIQCLASSAMGLSNAASRSGAGTRLAQLGRALAEVSAFSEIPILFKFGQVDVEFVFNFDRIKNDQFKFCGDKFGLFCLRSVDSYLDFVSEHFSGNCVSIISLFPPALSDASWREGYANAHVVAIESSQGLDEVIAGVQKLEIPSLPERTRLHAYYNRLLREKAAQKKFGFLHDFPYFLGQDGVLDPSFIPTHRGTDHHLEAHPTTLLIHELIAKQLT